MEYVASKDYKPYNDLFDPIGRPVNDHIRMASNVDVHFISLKSEVKFLEVLVG